MSEDQNAVNPPGEAKSSSKKAGYLSRADQAIAERLVKGEKVLVQSRIHAGIYWRSAAVFVVAILVALFLAVELGILLVVVAGLMAVYAALLSSILMFVVTNKRILARYGILQIDVVDLHFDKIESVELERMLPGYLMGYSNLVVMGTGNRYIVIPYIANGVEVRRAYNEVTLEDKE